MSQRLIGRSPDLARLRHQGYNIRVKAGFLLVHDVPYLTADRVVKRGTLVAKLVLAGEVAAAPDDHVIHFDGEYPRNADGSQIHGIRNSSEAKQLAEGVSVRHTFSAKPTEPFKDYHAKVANYCAILSGPARSVDPTVTAKTFAPPVPDDEEKSPFRYVDTASSRAEIDLLTDKLAQSRVAIVGLGGTGSYVLDLVAKTPVGQVHLYDADLFLTHNAFRAPGAPSLDDLERKPTKVDYLAGIYSKMHTGIRPHPVHISAANIAELDAMAFVFICMDDGPAKKLVVERLHHANVPFVDAGMGVYVGASGLGGLVRVTTSTSGNQDHIPRRIPFSEAGNENEYAKNIQVADLNALNAALAVIRWKKHVGFYMDFAREHHCTFGIEVQTLTRAEERA
ncbi:MAG: ThiF family adenylyltransferase [Phycisphaerales bacterium]